MTKETQSFKSLNFVEKILVVIGIIFTTLLFGTLIYNSPKIIKSMFSPESSTPAPSDCYGLAGCLTEQEPQEYDPAMDPRADYMPDDGSGACEDYLSVEECSDE